MTTNQHPITPSPELRRQWLDNDHFPMVTGTHDLLSITRDRLNSVIDQATQWGAAQELEATLGLMTTLNIRGVDYVRNARRSAKPPSLKEQALQALEEAEHADHPVQLTILNTTAHVLIREALQSIPEP